MKLPRGAFRLDETTALEVEHSGSLPGHVAMTLWEHVGGEWVPAMEWRSLKRAAGRKIIRMFLRANEVAEAWEHSSKIVRRGLR